MDLAFWNTQLNLLEFRNRMKEILFYCQVSANHSILNYTNHIFQPYDLYHLMILHNLFKSYPFQSMMNSDDFEFR